MLEHAEAVTGPGVGPLTAGIIERDPGIVPRLRGRSMNEPKFSLNARKPSGDTTSAISRMRR